MYQFQKNELSDDCLLNTLMPSDDKLPLKGIIHLNFPELLSEKFVNCVLICLQESRKFFERSAPPNIISQEFMKYSTLLTVYCDLGCQIWFLKEIICFDCSNLDIDNYSFLSSLCYSYTATKINLLFPSFI